MRPSTNQPRSGPPTDPDSFSGKAEAGAPGGLTGLPRSLEALESALAAFRERVGRLEGDVRTLQSQNTNRS